MVGGFSFYERKEVVDLLAYLRLVSNPHDSMALSRIINVPARAIGERTLKTLQELALKADQSIWAVLGDAIKNRLFTTRTLMALESFRQLILDAQAMMDPDFAGKLAADVAESRADDADTGFGFGAAATNAEMPASDNQIGGDQDQMHLLDASHFLDSSPKPEQPETQSEESRKPQASVLPATLPRSPSSSASSSTAPATSKPSKPRARPRLSAALRT